MSNFFKDRVNDTLAELTWTAADSLETLRMMKGEIKVKKRLSFGMALAIAILAIGMAFAMAEIIRYSVRDYHGLDTQTYRDQIIQIDKEDSGADISLYMGDAVFDGERLSVALEIKPVSGQVVYLVPEITGESGGRIIRPRIAGSRGGDFNNGFWINSENKLGYTDGKYGFDAQVKPGDATGDVNWSLKIHILQPVWDTVDDAAGYSDDTDGPSDHDAWIKQFKDAYQKRQIMLVHGHDMFIFNTLLPGQEADPLAQRLLESGAFISMGEQQVTFTTPAADVKPASIVGKTLSFDGFEVFIERLDVSFMRVTYRFVVTITKPEQGLKLRVGDKLISYLPTAQGYDLRMVASGAGVPEEDPLGPVASFSGEFIGTGEMPTEIVFKPHYYDAQGENVFLELGAFTVTLK